MYIYIYIFISAVVFSKAVNERTTINVSFDAATGCFYLRFYVPLISHQEIFYCLLRNENNGAGNINNNNNIIININNTGNRSSNKNQRVIWLGFLWYESLASLGWIIFAQFLVLSAISVQRLRNEIKFNFVSNLNQPSSSFLSFFSALPRSTKRRSNELELFKSFKSSRADNSTATTNGRNVRIQGGGGEGGGGGEI